MGRGPSARSPHPPPQSPLGLPPPPAANSPAAAGTNNGTPSSRGENRGGERRGGDRGRAGTARAGLREPRGRRPLRALRAAGRAPCPPPLSPALRGRHRLPQRGDGDREVAVSWVLRVREKGDRGAGILRRRREIMRDGGAGGDGAREAASAPGVPALSC